ncbi:hypothetical protein M758_1G256000 [Ceratodon purpureus]|nr:hypothetical protein M758_1G256000 [Ceratodon purpureus]
MATAALASGVCVEGTLASNLHATAGRNSCIASQLRPQPSFLGVSRASSPFLGLRVRQSRAASSRRSETCSALRVESSAVDVNEGVEEAKEERSVIVIDNYDSFTYNLVQYLGDLGCKIEVYRNDEITVDELRAKKPRGILISPGPGAPQDSGISLQVVRELGPTIPLFGVCMGLQCMGEAFGGKIVRAPNGVMHGKSSPVFHDEKGEPGLLDGLPSPFTACRYHSLVIEQETFPADQLEVTAWTEDGLVMGVRHRVYKHIQGVQFHPESIITQNGMQIVGNFLKMLDRKEAADQEGTEAKVLETA